MDAQKNRVGLISSLILGILLTTMAAGYAVGTNQVFDSGSLSYFVSSSTAAVITPTACAGTMAAGHLSISTYTRTAPGKFSATPSNSWQFAWTAYKGESGLVAYDVNSKACKKFFYAKAAALNNDVLTPLSLPVAMSNDAAIAASLAKTGITTGKSGASFTTMDPRSGLVAFYGANSAAVMSLYSQYMK